MNGGLVDDWWFDWQIEWQPALLLMEKLLKQMLDHIFWGCFGVSHASHVTATTAKSLQSCPNLCDPIPGWSQKFLSSHKDDIGDGKEEEKERKGIKDSRIKEELEITGVKQLAEKLAMAADLLKYSPHSEITDVIWGICVSICKLLLSMPFSFSLLPTTAACCLSIHSQKVLFLLSQREN